MKPILIIKAGAKLPSLAQSITRVEGDFEHWIMRGLYSDRAQPETSQVVRVYKGESLPDYAAIAGVIITGSSAMVTDKSDWIEYTASWVKQAVELAIPVLGICFGHQLLAYALGGDVQDNPAGVEVGTVPLQLQAGAKQDAFISVLTEPCLVQMSHRQTVLRLPAGAIHLASTVQTKYAAFRYGKQAWGVQFHPEFDDNIISAYINYYVEDLKKQKQDLDETLQAIRPTDSSRQLLVHFTRLVQQ